MQDEGGNRPRGWRLPAWLTIVVIASVAFTFAFACAMPFAAVATVAALTLSRRDACYLAGATWLASQAVGFVFLHYPWTWDSLTWGVMLGISALLPTLAASELIPRLGRMGSVTRVGVVFLAAFATYEAVLIATSLVLGGIENHALAIQWKIFAMNAVALAGLLVLSRAGVSFGIAPSIRVRLAGADPQT